MAETSNETVNLENEEEEKKIPNDTQETEEEEEKGEEISFIEQVSTALTTAKSDNKLLMVLCENAQELNGQIWNHPDMVTSIKKHAVCLLIRAQTLAYTQFTTLYPVVQFPTVYMINPHNGQVLQCNFKTEHINVESILTNIDLAYQKMIEMQQAASNRAQLQIQEITRAAQQLNANNNNNDNNNDNNNPDVATQNDSNSASISINEMEMRDQDSLASTAIQSPQPQPKKVKKSAQSKLEEIRYDM